MDFVHPIVPVKWKPLTAEIIGAAIEVHRALGPGLIESVYCGCLEQELGLRRLPFLREQPIAVEYKGSHHPNAFRADFIVARQVIVEVKSVSSLDRIHEVQLSTYLKLAGLQVGLLMNFNVPVLRHGIRRIVRSRTPGGNVESFPASLSFPTPQEL